MGLGNGFHMLIVVSDYLPHYPESLPGPPPVTLQ